MRALLVYPEFPNTYWGFAHSLPLLDKGAILPPLGLVSVAALLPQSWQMRLVDMNVRPLTDEDLRWADTVLMSGMLVQEPSMHDVIARAHRVGRRTIVGGPACTTAPERFSDADFVFRGEAEGRLDELRKAVEGGASRMLAPPEKRPSMQDAFVPRFNLLDIGKYRSMSIQTSRGCPFNCEFCDIIEIYGRLPRVKTPAQVTAELDELHRLGHRGEVFLVDDNFIGNKKAVFPILAELERWQMQMGTPFTFYTEASLNLAADAKLVAAMRAASFNAVFIGIETPDDAALKLTLKTQNVGVDVRAALDLLTEAGLEVMAGFIVGFDGDGPHSFAAQRTLLESAPLPLAMVGLLTALPGTKLWRRLEREGRLRTHSNGDAFGRPNFQPTMPEHELVEHYAQLISDLYSTDAYYARSAAVVDRIAPPAQPSALLQEDIRIALRALFSLGVVSERRGHFWKLLARAIPRGRHAVRTAIACAIRGEHMIRYTHEVVLPRLAEARATMAEEMRPSSELRAPLAAE